jgi:type IV secretory pathway VirD2 relaxase
VNPKQEIMSPTSEDLDDLPIFRPRLRRGYRRATDVRDTTFRNVLLRGLRRGAAARRTGPRQGAAAFGGANARRVVVKAHVVRMNASGAKAASLHIRYIERDGVEKDGSKGVLYTADGPARARSFEQPRVGEEHQFRLIVSPEDAGELDLTEYVRRLMARVERDLRRKLEWAAVNHHDTDHPHAHVVIRGVDKDGHELRLDREYISKGLRWRAQEIATEELGPRPELDVRRAHIREITQNRFTSLDRDLERRAQDKSVVEIRAAAWRGFIDPSVLVGRLEHLEGLRLAERVSTTAWSLTEGWQQALRDLGTRGDILKQIHRAVSGDPARYHVVRAGQALQADATGGQKIITGRVASKGLSDELKGSFYAVIETPTGRAYHVPLDARSAEALRPGDIVSLASKPEAPVRAVDRHIADVAGKGGGIYELERDSSPDAGRAARRMRDLERLGLATAAGPDRWTVSPNLVADLERKHRDAPPRHRLLLHKQPLSIQAQVGHPGPVWLDRIDAASLAPYGLGAEVRRAVGQRRDMLRQLGIAADDPNRWVKLRELERRSVGNDVAASSGQSFVPGTPNTFRGRVLSTHASPTGTSHTVVSDGERFVLVSSTPSLRSLQGRVVTLSRDAKGRLVAREAPARGPER